jgi:hypothetical protein
MEVLDKPKRRDRNKRVPTGKEIELQLRDLWGIFRPIYEHGQLSTNYLYEFTKPYSTSLYSLKNRLKDLYHEDNTPHDGWYLRRMKEHPELPDRNRFAIYDVTQQAEHALEEAGYKPLKRSFALDLDPHRFMIACTGASLEIAVNEDPTLKWESRSSILQEAGHKWLHIKPCVISHKGSKSIHDLEPDDLFGIEYAGNYWRLFAVECDRGNEPYERADLDETSLHAKFLRYKHVIEKGIYKDHFGRKCGLLVLFIFTTTTKQDEFLRRVEEWNHGPCSWILAKTVPSFGKKLSIPEVMRELLTVPWHRAGFAHLDISKPN